MDFGNIATEVRSKLVPRSSMANNEDFGVTLCSFSELIEYYLRCSGCTMLIEYVGVDVKE